MIIIKLVRLRCWRSVQAEGINGLSRGNQGRSRRCGEENMMLSASVRRTARVVAVGWVRVAVIVLSAALLCACGGGVASPVDTAVTAVVSVNQEVPSVPSPALGTSQPASAGGHANPPSTTTPANNTAADIVQVTKCYTNATLSGGGELLIKANSSDRAARLFAYRPDGALIGELQNGGGSRYGGTVMPYQPYDPVKVTVKSSSGGSVTVPTTGFQPDS